MSLESMYLILDKPWIFLPNSHSPPQMDFDVISAQVQRTLRSVKNTGCASLTQMVVLPRLKVRGINQRRVAWGSVLWPCPRQMLSWMVSWQHLADFLLGEEMLYPSTLDLTCVSKIWFQTGKCLQKKKTNHCDRFAWCLEISKEGKWILFGDHLPQCGIDGPRGITKPSRLGFPWSWSHTWSPLDRSWRLAEPMGTEIFLWSATWICWVSMEFWCTFWDVFALSFGLVNWYSSVVQYCDVF